MPMASNPQAFNRYSYTGGNPVNRIDPTGHDEIPWWSTGPIYFNSELGNAFGIAALVLQDIATFCSFAGGSIETGGALYGAVKGAPVGVVFGLGDGPAPVIESVVGLAGLVEGATWGHNLHKKTTNKLETFFSTLSLVATAASDVALGKTRLDLYEDRAEILVGESTATAIVTTAVGNMNRTGVVDFLIDGYASLASHNVLPGVYDILGVRGEKIRLAGSNDLDPFLPIPRVSKPVFDIYLRFGDSYEE